MDKAYLFYSLSKFYIVKLSRRTYIVSVHIVVTIGTPVPSIITSGNAKVPTITITPISNGIPLEEQREEKGNVTPYEKSFAYIIEYKADFPYTTTGLSLSIHPQKSTLNFHVWSVAYERRAMYSGAYIIFRRRAIRIHLFSRLLSDILFSDVRATLQYVLLLATHSTHTRTHSTCSSACVSLRRNRLNGPTKRHLILNFDALDG